MTPDDEVDNGVTVVLFDREGNTIATLHILKESAGYKVQHYAAGKGGHDVLQSDDRLTLSVHDVLKILTDEAAP